MERARKGIKAHSRLLSRYGIPTPLAYASRYYRPAFPPSRSCRRAMLSPLLGALGYVKDLLTKPVFHLACWPQSPGPCQP